MADAKITDLTELAVTPDGGDVLAIVDLDAVPATTKKISVTNLVDNNANVLANTAHTVGDGSDHADVATNSVHSSGDGSDHSDVALNNSHRVDVANPHSVTATQVGLGNVPNVDATDRANHTGTQLSSTISDFAATVRATILTGISFASSSAVLAADTILVAIGKLQAQITALPIGTKNIFSNYIVGTTSGPTSSATSSATATVIAEMTKTFTPADASNKIDVFFSGTFGETTSGKDATVRIGMFVDGTLQASTERAQTVKGNVATSKLGSVYTQWQGSLSAASHTIDVRFWRDDAGDGSVMQAIGVLRNLIIKEIDE